MSKKIEDYLPYYIGQEVNSGEGTMIYKLSSVDIKGRCMFLDMYENEMWLHDGWKLVLRPLSSMTEEEAKTVVRLHFKTFSTPIYEGHSSVCIDMKFEAYAPNKFNYTQIDFDRITPATMHYLLKQGFDLFGLIDAGLAIDKTKEVTDVVK